MGSSSTAAEIGLHFGALLQGIIDGRVTPFLGAGVNLCTRPKKFEWNENQHDYLPNGAELAKHLNGPLAEAIPHSSDLVRMAQSVALIQGLGPLYNTLHKLFNADYPSTPLHQFFAALPAALRTKGYQPRYLVHITTNYDDLLERAFQAAGEPYDVVTYITDGDDRGKFFHVPPEGKPRLIERPNEYTDVSPEKRSVILKIHGTVERNKLEEGQAWSRDETCGDSFVITEDHYIDYLTRTEISGLLPVFLAARMKKSHMLFLGYALRDWNLRVILRRIAGSQKLAYQSWAIQWEPDQLDRKYWAGHGVAILDMDLCKYIDILKERLEVLPRK